MICKAVNRDIPPANADNTFDDADIDILFMQDCALLDVQFNECFEFSPFRIELFDTFTYHLIYDS